MSALAAATTHAERRSPPAVRGATIADVPAIVALIDRYAGAEVMLPRSAESVVVALDHFLVAVDAPGAVVGCGALKEYSPSLAEVASLAVSPDSQGHGIGRMLVERLESLAAMRGIEELFALTLTAHFFESLGYEVTDRAHFPEKVQRDCAGCTRRSRCVETCVRRRLEQQRLAVAA